MYLLFSPSPELPVTGAISQSHLPSLTIPANQQRMAPPNITVQTTAPRGSELFSPPGSQLSTSLNPTMSMALNQSQFNQPQARRSPLPSIGLQQIQQQQHFNNITGPVTTMANTSVDTASVPTTVGGIAVSQFNSALQPGHSQMTDAFKNRQIAVSMEGFFICLNIYSNLYAQLIGSQFSFYQN